MNAKGGYVYILSNKNRTVIYVGVTSDIRRRVYQHRFEKGSVFTSKYNVHHLMYFEFFNSIEEAIANEKKFKNNKRAWKIQLIKRDNPNMIDLAEEWYKEDYE